MRNKVLFIPNYILTMLDKVGVSLDDLDVALSNGDLDKVLSKYMSSSNVKTITVLSDRITSGVYGDTIPTCNIDLNIFESIDGRENAEKSYTIYRNNILVVVGLNNILDMILHDQEGLIKTTRKGMVKTLTDIHGKDVHRKIDTNLMKQYILDVRR